MENCDEREQVYVRKLIEKDYPIYRVLVQKCVCKKAYASTLERSKCCK